MVLLGVEKTDEFRWLEEPIEDWRFSSSRRVIDGDLGTV
jgi:hypothetical protein